jgi:hypothetical protein
VRYIVVRGRLWRATNPQLSDQLVRKHTAELMSARRAVREALKLCDDAAERQARERVHAAKLALGERGPPWWDDGALDENRKLVRNSSYADWWAGRDCD